MGYKKGISLSQNTAEEIIKIIRESHLQPGERLANEYELAKTLNVSRSTVRESIKILESRNIVTIKRGSGTYISQKQGVVSDPLGIALIGNDESVALELLDVRMILEPESAAMAAKNASDNDIIAIKNQNKKVIHMINHGLNHSEEDAKFHQLIAQSTQNRIIAKLIPIIYHSIGMTIEMTNKRLSDTTIVFHNQIVEAIERRDTIGARSAMSAHISENRIYIINEIERKQKTLIV